MVQVVVLVEMHCDSSPRSLLQLENPVSRYVDGNKKATRLKMKITSNVQ